MQNEPQTKRLALLSSLLPLAVLSLACAGGRAALAPSAAPFPASAVIERPALYPETVVYDPRRDAFLLGSVREGGVHRIDAAGHTEVLVDDARLSSVLGIAIDVARDRLWVTNANLGLSTRPRAEAPKQLAGVGLYALSTGRALGYFDLAPLAEGPHLLNGIALDADGNAYVTDSFAPVIFRIGADGSARVLVRDARFAGEGINLNGIVAHPDGYLLVVKKSDGALFKVPIAAPHALTQVALAQPLVGGDGLLLVQPGQLVVVANRAGAVTTDAVLGLTSDDGWASAKLGRALPLGAVYPTTAAQRGGRLFVLHSKLDALLQAPPEARAALRERARLSDVGPVEALLRPASAAPVPSAAVQRVLLAQQDLADRPGWESRLYLVDFPPGAASPLHVHPVPCVGYVLEGRFESSFGGAPATIKRAGDAFVDLPEQPHTFRNPDPAQRLRFLVSGTFPKDAPLFRPVGP